MTVRWKRSEAAALPTSAQRQRQWRWRRYQRGYATTGADAAQLGAVGMAVLGNAPVALAGIVLSAGITQNTGSNPYSAAIDLAHDMSLGLGQAVTANPSLSMYQTSAIPIGGSYLDASTDNTYVPYPGGGGFRKVRGVLKDVITHGRSFTPDGTPRDRRRNDNSAELSRT